jgi:hypothetical protein
MFNEYMKCCSSLSTIGVEQISAQFDNTSYRAKFLKGKKHKQDQVWYGMFTFCRLDYGSQEPLWKTVEQTHTCQDPANSSLVCTEQITCI